MRTPWGNSQFIERIADGIEFVSTASHGGFKLSKARLAEMTVCLRNVGEKSRYHGPGGWFEEDCEAAAVIVAFPEYFPTEIQQRDARRALKTYYGIELPSYEKPIEVLHQELEQVISVEDELGHPDIHTEDYLRDEIARR